MLLYLCYGIGLGLLLFVALLFVIRITASLSDKTRYAMLDGKFCLNLPILELLFGNSFSIKPFCFTILFSYFRLQLDFLDVKADESKPFPSIHDPPTLDLTIVIPAYNESKRLPVFLDVLFPYLDTVEYSYEIIVVDDGSKDNTVEVVHGYSKQHGSDVIRFLLFFFK